MTVSTTADLRTVFLAALNYAYERGHEDGQAVPYDIISIPDQQAEADRLFSLVAARHAAEIAELRADLKWSRERHHESELKIVKLKERLMNAPVQSPATPTAATVEAAISAMTPEQVQANWPEKLRRDAGLYEATTAAKPAAEQSETVDGYDDAFVERILSAQVSGQPISGDELMNQIETLMDAPEAATVEDKPPRDIILESLEREFKEADAAFAHKQSSLSELLPTSINRLGDGSKERARRDAAQADLEAYRSRNGR